MSPAALRRYRAERMLADEFQALKSSVCGKVVRRLSRHGVPAEGIDVEGCYAIAWNGLYAVVSGGREIVNPAGWLVRATYRRAIDEHLLRVRDLPNQPGELGEQALDRDFAQELDDRARLRHLFEAMRGRLGTRERQAASLCYLQGLSRAEAAERMGISDRHMSRLMEGRGRTRPGVAAQLGALAATIASGKWCEEQGSLIRALALGILDPDGERHQLAIAHARECPACRSYVTSVRGLAAILPPVFLPLAPGVFVGLGGGAISAGGAWAVSTGATGGTAASGAATGSGFGGAASLGSSLGAKLAIGGLLGAGIAAGAVSVAVHSPGRALASQGAPGHATSAQTPPHQRAAAADHIVQSPRAPSGATGTGINRSVGPRAASSKPPTSGTRAKAPARTSQRRPAAKKPPVSRPTRSAQVQEPRTRAAEHEFGPEHPAARTPGTTSAGSSARPEHAAEQEFGIE